MPADSQCLDRTTDAADNVHGKMRSVALVLLFAMLGGSVKERGGSNIRVIVCTYIPTSAIRALHTLAITAPAFVARQEHRISQHVED